MPFFLLFIGVIFLVAVIRGNQNDLIELLQEDFSGKNNFVLWVMAIVVIVLIGNIRALRPISNAFLGLVILVIILATYKNGQGLFDSFINQVRNGTA